MKLTVFGQALTNKFLFFLLIVKNDENILFLIWREVFMDYSGIISTA